MKNKSVELDAMVGRILSHTTTSALFFTTSSSLPGGMPQSALEETICFTTSSLRPFQEAFNMELWLWVLSTPSFTPTTVTAEIRTIQETLGIAWKGESDL